MRILITAQAGYSHLVPLVLPVAELARSAGHEVAVATGPDMTDLIEKRGLEALPLPQVVPLPKALAAEGRSMPEGFGQVTVELEPEFFANNFVSALGRRSADDLLVAMEKWRPGLVLRESTEFGGYLAAERLGVPHAALDIAPMAPYSHPVVTECLNQQRERLGLEAVDDPWHALRPFRAGVVPEEFYPANSRLPGARYYRPSLPDERDRLDPAIAELPLDRPVVLASLGSQASRFPAGARLLDTVIEALGQLPVTGVVAIGADRDPRQWQGARADNVHLTPFVQQDLLLQSSDLFITHTGFNGTREAIAAGVPMVAVPMFAEQSLNATRLEQLGIGRRINVEDLTRDSLAQAVRTLLEDRTFRACAQGLQRRGHALPPLQQIVEDLAALAR
ncbi:glycosyltransferase [Streptomyces sp. NPDC055105]|uniref:glycosyltransferase n=1 Tax=Streptomyces sp. NPDC055105 TaxID=3365719 RepID=UPI0037CD16E3